MASSVSNSPALAPVDDPFDPCGPYESDDSSGSNDEAAASNAGPPQGHEVLARAPGQRSGAGDPAPRPRRHSLDALRSTLSAPAPTSRRRARDATAQPPIELRDIPPRRQDGHPVNEDAQFMRLPVEMRAAIFGMLRAQFDDDPRRDRATEAGRALVASGRTCRQLRHELGALPAMAATTLQSLHLMSHPDWSMPDLLWVLSNTRHLSDEPVPVSDMPRSALNNVRNCEAMVTAQPVGSRDPRHVEPALSSPRFYALFSFMQTLAKPVEGSTITARTCVMVRRGIAAAFEGRQAPPLPPMAGTAVLMVAALVAKKAKQPEKLALWKLVLDHAAETPPLIANALLNDAAQDSHRGRPSRWRDVRIEGHALRRRVLDGWERLPDTHRQLVEPPLHGLMEDMAGMRDADASLALFDRIADAYAGGPPSVCMEDPQGVHPMLAAWRGLPSPVPERQHQSLLREIRRLRQDDPITFGLSRVALSLKCMTQPGDAASKAREFDAALDEIMDLRPPALAGELDDWEAFREREALDKLHRMVDRLAPDD